MLKYAILLIFTSLIIFCSSSNISDSSGKPGGSTEVIGMIFDSTGIPVEGVKVFFVPQNYIPNNPETNTIDSTYTDENGTFDFSELLDGNYNFMYEKSGLYGRTEDVIIQSGGIDYPISDTLEIPGSIKGIATLLPQHDNRQIYILIIGTNRFTSADSLGNFSFYNLAEGNYNLKVLTTEENYGVIDTTIKVNVKTNTIITDTLEMPFLGIPTPERVTAHYDTLKQRVTLNWSSVNATKLAGYNIYRKSDKEKGYTLITSRPISDTTFTDSADGENNISGKSCQYRIGSVDDEGQSGKYSSPVNVMFSTIFIEGDSFKISNSMNIKNGCISLHDEKKLSAIICNSKNIFNIDISEKSIDSNTSIDLGVTPYDMNIMSDSTILMATDKGIYNIDKSGNKLYWYNIKTTHVESQSSRYIYYSSSNTFFSSINTIIQLDSYTGIEDTLFSINDNKLVSFVKDNSSIYALFNIYGKLSLMEWKNNNLKEITSWINNCERENADIVLSDKHIIILAGNEIRILMKSSGNLISRTYLNCPAIKIASNSDNQIFILHSDGIIREIKR